MSSSPVTALGVEPGRALAGSCECPEPEPRSTPALQALPASWELEQLCLWSLPLCSSSRSTLLSLTSSQVPPRCPLHWELLLMSLPSS